MLDFYNFVTMLESDLRKNVMDVDVGFESIHKLQNESYVGLIIRPLNQNVSICLNLDLFYEQHRQGLEYTTIYSNAYEKVMDFIDSNMQLNEDYYSNYTYVKKHLFVEVVEMERNKEMLLNVPYTILENLAIVYRIDVDVKNSDSSEMASILITNDLLRRLGVSIEQLHFDAIENSSIIRPLKVECLGHFITNVLGSNPYENDNSNTYIISNSQMSKGASALFYKGVLEKLANLVNGNYYILPSSVHEVLIVKDNGKFNIDDLRNMVTSINNDFVEPTDVLSNQVYYFDAKVNKFYMAQ